MSQFAASHKVELTDLPIEQVVVYSNDANSAQVRRIYNAQLTEGFNEIIVQGLPADLVDNSLRVAGKGSAVIHDVSVKRQHGADMIYPPRVLALKLAFEEKEAKMNSVDDRKSILLKQIDGLNNLVSEAGKSRDADGFVFNSKTVESLNHLNGYYKQQTQALKEEHRHVELEFKKAEEEFNYARNAYDATGYRFKDGTQYGSIVVESPEGNADVSLEISYQVYNVSWRPFYDVRVTSSDEPQLHITYYGKIRQCSGEEWNNVPLVLSTAQPARGAQQLPKLGTVDVSIVVPEPQCEINQVRYAMASYDSAPVASFSRKMKSSVAVVSRSNISTEFAIPRKVTIEDRTEEFKVTIGSINLSTNLTHATVPSHNTTAFLVATTVNSSEYPFVAGEASIFLDGTFVNKIDFEDVVVNQKFVCSLGADPSVRVQYKPVKDYQEEVGDVKKLNSRATEKTVVVQNLRDDDVLLTIKEQIPRSADQKINVHLVNPDSTEEESNTPVKEGAVLTKENNLDYTVKLASGEEKTVVIKYVIDYPKEEKIQFDQKY